MILTIITFIIMLSVLVVVHEYGHFLFARLCGIKVKEFAIGFGPKLFTWLKKNGTEFNFRAYPLGGFVAMAGESLEEMDEKDGFQSQSAWKRFLVVFAGPLFSFLFAVLIFVSIGYFFGFPTGTNSNKIQMVMPQTKASAIGLRAGDEIISVNGVKSTDGSYVDIVHASAGKEIKLEIKRGSRIISLSATPDLMLRFAGVSFKENPSRIGVIFDSVSRESELYKKGISNGDVLLSLDGKDIESVNDVKKFLDSFAGREISFVTERGNELKTVSINYTPSSYECGDLSLYFPEMLFLKNENKNINIPFIEEGDRLTEINGIPLKTEKDFEKWIGKKINTVSVDRLEEKKTFSFDNPLVFKPVYYNAVGAFGFMPAPKLEKTGLGKSVSVGCAYIGRIVKELFIVLTSREIKENVGGPIAIASATNSAVNTGLFSIVLLTGGLSLSLAILNLLPIPVLDGGAIFVMFLEFIRRKRFTKDELVVIQSIGLFILIIIFISVMYSDISKLLTGMLPK